MAKDFLLASPTYQKGVRLRIIQRRHIVCEHLDEEYTFPPKERRIPKVIEILKERSRFKAETSTISNDGRLYKEAYQYLTGSPERRKELDVRLQNFDGKQSSELMGIWCLLKDGISSWECIPWNVVEEEERKLVAAFPTPREVSPLPPQSPPSVSGELATIFKQFKTNWALLQESTSLLERLVSQLQQEKEELQRSNEFLKKVITQRSRETSTIDRQSIETLAYSFPDEFAQLSPILRKIEERIAKEEVESNEGFPQMALWSDMEETGVEYTETFLSAYQGYSESERRSIIKALQLLTASREGQRHPSLRSHKVPPTFPATPEDASVSRASDQLRFTWRKEGDILRVYELFQKGDHKYYDSEA